jgi:sarcosine oxidase subunit alpha
VDAGVSVAAIVDVRENPDGELVSDARSRGIEILANHAVTRVKGKLAVSEVEVRRLTSDGKSVTSDGRSISCDMVLSSAGWQPTVHLFSQSRGKVKWNQDILAFVPDKPLPGQNNQSVGAARGRFALADCLIDATPPAAPRTPPVSPSPQAARRLRAPSRRWARCARCGSSPRPSRSATRASTSSTTRTT